MYDYEYELKHGFDPLDHPVMPPMNIEPLTNKQIVWLVISLGSATILTFGMLYVLFKY